MTKCDVVEKLYKDGTVDRIIYKLLSSSKNPFDCPEDLIQEIYVLLLEKDDNLIVNLYNKGEIGFYLLKIARNQLLSVNSKYYYTYIKFRSQSDELEKGAHIPIEDN